MVHRCQGMRKKSISPRIDRLKDHGYVLADSLPMNHFEPRFSRPE